jgi:hypothetical protein
MVFNGGMWFVFWLGGTQKAVIIVQKERESVLQCVTAYNMADRYRNFAEISCMIFQGKKVKLSLA